MLREGAVACRDRQGDGAPAEAIYAMIYKAGGIRPATRVRSPRQLSLVEREEVSGGLAAGESCRAIAARLGPRAVDDQP